MLETFKLIAFESIKYYYFVCAMDAHTITLITNAVQIHCPFSEQSHAAAKHRLEALNIYKTTFERNYFGEFDRLLKMSGNLSALFKELSTVRFPGCGPLTSFKGGHKLPAHLPQILNAAYKDAAATEPVEWHKPEPIKRRSSSFDTLPLCDYIAFDLCDEPKGRDKMDEPTGRDKMDEPTGRDKRIYHMGVQKIAPKDAPTDAPESAGEFTAKRGISMQYHSGRIKILSVAKIDHLSEISITVEIYDIAAKVPNRKVFRVGGSPTVDELQRMITRVENYIDEHYLFRYLISVRIGVNAVPTHRDQVAILLDDKMVKFKVNKRLLDHSCNYELQCRNYACSFTHKQCSCLGNPNCLLNSAHLLNFHLDKSNSLINWDPQTRKYVKLEDSKHLYYLVL